MQLRIEESGKTEKYMLSLTQNFLGRNKDIDRNASVLNHIYVMKAANEPAASYLRVEAGKRSFL